MSKNALVDIFAEDHAHEAFIRAIVRRISREYQKSIRPLRVRNARGGHGRVMTELKLFQRSVLRPVFDELPDLLIIAIDANCQHFAKARKEIEKAIDPEFLDRTAIACPDPHIEKWYLADPESFSDIVGRQPRLVRKKCERDRYKSLLAETIRVAGHPPILGGIEFAEDLVNAMDFYRAGKNDRSFQTFIDSLRSQFKRI